MASGSWLYDGIIPQRVTIIARDYDIEYSMFEADGLLEAGEQPEEPGPDGLYYYASNTGPFKSLGDAMEWANKQWGPIDWDE